MVAYVGFDALWAVILVVGFASAALKAGANLRANSNTISRLEFSHFVTHTGNVADNFVTSNERELRLAPALSQSVYVRAAYTAVSDSDLNVFWLERFGLE